MSEVARLWLGDSPSTFVQFHKRAPGAQLQQNVHIFVVLEEALHLDNMWMGERLVDLDLLRHLKFMVKGFKQIQNDSNSKNEITLSR